MQGARGDRQQVRLFPTAQRQRPWDKDQAATSPLFAESPRCCDGPGVQVMGKECGTVTVVHMRQWRVSQHQVGRIWSPGQRDKGQGVRRGKGRETPESTTFPGFWEFNLQCCLVLDFVCKPKMGKDFGNLTVSPTVC